MPGIMMADACVKAAVSAANAALASAGLSVRLGANLQHEPPVLPAYALRPLDGVQGYWVAGPDATPGAPLHGGDLELIESAPDKVSYREVTFTAAGFQSSIFVSNGKVRGTPSAASLFLYSDDRVFLIAGTYERGDLVDVATLAVRVGVPPATRTYPNAICTAPLGRWTLSYAPLWRAVEPENLASSTAGERIFREPAE
jgi:hypothetical protein